jgi:hypothetical protein
MGNHDPYSDNTLYHGNSAGQTIESRAASASSARDGHVWYIS